LIKNIICGNNYCISFAGNKLVYANELLSKINHISLEELLEIALDIHLRDIENGMDFIVGYCTSKKCQLFEIKNGACTEQDTVWIGSYDAFRYFQQIRLGGERKIAESNNPLGVEIFFGTTAKNKIDEEYNNLFDAFIKTIMDCGDSSVGGIVVPILYEKEKQRLIYKGYAKSYAALEMIRGIACLPMYQGASKGTYSILFYTSESIAGLYIPQAYLGLVFNHYRKNPIDYDNGGTSSLLLPNITRMNQLDFYIQVGAQGLKAPGFLGCDPDDIEEIFKRVSLYKDNPTMALLYINKIIEIIEMQHRETSRLEEFLLIKQDIESSIREL
jgi:hypothetical protein